MKTYTTVTYETDDGQTFRDETKAILHDAELHAVDRFSHTPEELDDMLATLIAHGLLSKYTKKGLKNWRDAYTKSKFWDESEHIVDEMVKTYEQYADGTALVIDDEYDEVLAQIDNINFLKESTARVITKLERMISDDYDVKLDSQRHDHNACIVLVTTKKPMSIHEKLEKDMALSDDELSELVYDENPDFPVVYEETGENKRWNRCVSTVCKDNQTGILWCIDWLNGLTESQEDRFPEQPRKVILEQTPVTVMKTTIKDAE